MVWRVCLLGVICGVSIAGGSTGSASAFDSSAALASRAGQRPVASVSAGSVLVVGGPGGVDKFAGGSVYAVDLGGGPLKELVPGPVETAQWSPDGRSLAVIRLPTCAQCGPELEVTNADGSAERPLVALLNAFGQIAWSPNSRRIAYSDGVVGEIRVIGADGRGGRLLARGSSFSWSPDGTKLAFTRSVGGFNELFTVDTRTPRRGHLPHVARLTHRQGVGSLFVTAPAASWSPDGKKIAFSVFPQAGFAMLDVRSGRIRKYGSGRDPATPEWSPDGRWLSLIGYDDDTLQVVRPDGSGAHVIASIPYLRSGLSGADWSPDSQQLAVEVPSGGGPAVVWSVAADGSGARTLTEGGRLGYSDSLEGWQPTGRTTAMLAGRVVSPAVPTDSLADGDTLRTTKPILSLAAAGDSGPVAIQYPYQLPRFEGPIPTSCTEVWDPATETIIRFLPSAGCANAPNHSSMAFDGNRLLWTSGPNRGAGTELWIVDTATLQTPAHRQLAVLHGDLSAPVGEAGLFAYESWAAPCNSSSPNCNPPPPKRDGRLIRVDGSSASIAQVAASDGALTPLAVDNGRILVSNEDGSFEIVNSDGTRLVSFTVGPPLAAADDTDSVLQACLQGNDAVVVGRGYIAHFDATTGQLLGRFAVRLGTLDGCANGIVATAGPTTVTLTRLADGATATIDTGGIPTPDPGTVGASLPLPAQLTTAGLFYAWTVDDNAYPGRIAFIPTAKLPLH